MGSFFSDGHSPKMSNELEITLPLDISSFVLPPVEIRLDNNDLYTEYVEVREGSGYSAGMAQGKIGNVERNVS